MEPASVHAGHSTVTDFARFLGLWASPQTSLDGYAINAALRLNLP
jgi:hypothetical protein